MKLSVALKITIFTISLIVLTTSFLGIYFVWYEFNQVRFEFNKRGKIIIQTIADNSEWGVLTGDSQVLQQVIESAAKTEPDVSSIRIDSVDLGLLAKLENGIPGPYSEFKLPIVTRSKSLADDMLVDNLQDDNAQIIGKVTLSLSLAGRVKQMDRLKLVTILLVFLVVLLSSAAILIIAKTVISRPLDILMSGIKRISLGDFNYQVKVNASDEIGLLAEAFNAMGQALSATHVSRDFLDMIIQSMFNSLIVLDPDLKIKMVNTATCELLRYSGYELVDKHINDVLMDLKMDSRRISGIKNMELFFLAKDRARIPVIFSSVPFGGSEDDFRGFVCVAQDITERKWIEEQMRNFAFELERSNKELEQFAYIASHDLQEPLRMVASYIQLLARRYKDKLDSDANEFIEFAVDGARRMQGLIDALLMYSRIGRQEKPFTRVNMQDVLQRALDNLKVAIEDRGAKIECSGLPSVFGDEILLIQLFQNLIGNAIKFCDKNEPRVTVGYDDQEKKFYVRDNGQGINAKYYERIFVIFQRLHSRQEYPGTGIGLAVCKKIVEKHNGKIWVESIEGSGATFYFSLPQKGG